MSPEKAPVPRPEIEQPLQGYLKVSESRLPLPAGSEGGVDGWLVITTMELSGEPENPPEKPREAATYPETDDVVLSEHRLS